MEQRQPGTSPEPAAAVTETEWLLFKNSPIHGTGAFARKHIPVHTHVIEYIGEKIDKAESVRQCEANNEYVFSLNEQHDLDGNVPWNPARLINHSCAPNCEAVWEDNRIWIVATRDISPHEEVTFNYGFDLQDYRESPCRCGAPECVGYIVAEDFFDHLRRQAEPETGQERGPG